MPEEGTEDPLKKPKIREISQEEIDRKIKEGGFGGNEKGSEMPTFLRNQQQPKNLKELPQHVLTDDPPKN